VSGRPTRGTIPSVAEALRSVPDRRLYALVGGLRVIGDGFHDRGDPDTAQVLYALMIEAAEEEDRRRLVLHEIEMDLDHGGIGGIASAVD
jgi:hypothetical protein